MHNVLIRDGVVAHVWRGPIPDGIPNTFAVAPDSAHVGDRWENGTAVPAPKPVTVDEINAECERRILAVLPLTRQLNIVDEGTAAELQDMKDKRNALRSCARALISIQPSPANYRDDRYWVGAPWGSEPRQSHADRRTPDMQMHCQRPSRSGDVPLRCAGARMSADASPWASAETARQFHPPRQAAI